VLAALTVGLAVWYLLPYALGGFGLPLGPDAPVYLWWLRLAGLEGLSVVAARPGAPALALALAGTLGLGQVQVVAGLEGALGVSAGLASAALLRAAGVRRAAWATGGALAGTFAVHLAAGYLANLVFAVAFLAGAVALATGSRRGTVAGALALGAGGLAHPLFFAFGAAVLLLSAASAWRPQRAEGIRVVAATLGGAAIVGVGLLTLLSGPAPLEVDTSKDAFLRRAGLHAELRSAYTERFVQRWWRYVQWASVPLAILGLRDAHGFVGRFLRAWGLATIVGIAVALGTGIAPADRFVTFGFVVPILAALGLVRLWERLATRPAVAAVAVGGLGLAMLAGAWIAWDRQEPFVSDREIASVTDATPWIAASPPGTPLVFPVNEDDPAVTFLATRAGNVIRAAVPPDRIRDVVVVVPGVEGDHVDATRRALTRLTLGDATAAVEAADGRRLDVLLAPFDRPDASGADEPGSPWRRVATGVFVSGAVDGPARGADPDPLASSSPAGIAWATAAALGLLGAAGYGWARAALGEPIQAAALSPAFGAGALTLAAVALERLGVPLGGGAVGGILVSSIAGGGGYVAWLVLERRARARPSPQVDEQPDQ